MTPNPNDEIFFVAGGTLKATTPSYVERPADAELFEAVMDGQLCYVLTPRQMGKSSLMTRTSRKLKEQEIRTASIDLTSIGTQVTAQQWYTSIISQLTRQLNLGIDAQEWCKQQEGLAYIQTFTTFIEEIMLEKISGRVVIFIDEIDSTLSLNFRDDFFAGLRAIYNARTDKPAFERIAFVLLGVASPSDLIADKARTPFNIGRAIALQEFDFAHAHVLQTGLDAVYPAQGEPILQRIFHWTSGHPYLTQKLCSEIVERKGEAWNDAAIDQLVHELFLSEQARKETNLKFVQDRLLDNPRRAALLGLYQRILRGKVSEEGQSALQNELKLSGLVRVDDGLLKVRNLIYETVFTTHWAQVNTPKNWPKIAATILAVFSFILLAIVIWDNIIVSNVSKQYAGDIFTTRNADERLKNLGDMFALYGILTGNYTPLARETFYNLKWDEQKGLFTSPDITPLNKNKYLVPVIRELYITMANVSGGQDSTDLLDAMKEALKDVKSKESQKLEQEIDLWLQARRAGSSQKAIDNYTQAILLETSNPSTYFERAQVAMQMSQYELALSDLDKVITLAQDISTEAYEKEVPTLTPRPILTSSLAQTPASRLTPNLVTTLVNQTNIPLEPTLRALQLDATSQPRYGLRESYRSSFFSIAYIRSAVAYLIDTNRTNHFNEFVLSSDFTNNKYPNLKSNNIFGTMDILGAMASQTAIARTQADEKTNQPTLITIKRAPSHPSFDTVQIFEFTSPSATSFICTLDFNSFTGCTSPAVYFTLSPGAHTFRIRAIDSIGNISAPTIYNWIVNDTVLTSELGATTTLTNATFTFSTVYEDQGTTFECALDSDMSNPNFQPCSSPQRYSNLQSGKHTFMVRATKMGTAKNDLGQLVDTKIDDPTPAVYAWTILQ